MTLEGVAVSVVVYQPDLAAIAPALEGLRGLAARGVTLLIHANADPYGDVARELAERLRVEVSSSSANLGFAAGHNRLLSLAFQRGCRHVIVHNPDLLLEADAIAELERAATTVPQPALLGPLLQLGSPGSFEPEGVVDTAGIRWSRSGRHFDDGQGRPLPPIADPYRVAGISGACLLVTRETHERVVSATGEFFDEDFIAYREDAELSYRARLLGIRSWVVPTARGVHVRQSRGTNRGHNPDVDMLGVRNRFLIAFKYGRHRPGGCAAYLRDCVVLAALVRERSSWPGVVEAWRLRRHMREKGRRALAAAVVDARAALRP